MSKIFLIDPVWAARAYNKSSDNSFQSIEENSGKLVKRFNWRYGEPVAVVPTTESENKLHNYVAPSIISEDGSCHIRNLSGQLIGEWNENGFKYYHVSIFVIKVALFDIQRAMTLHNIK